MKIVFLFKQGLHVLMIYVFSHTFYVINQNDFFFPLKKKTSLVTSLPIIIYFFNFFFLAFELGFFHTSIFFFTGEEFSTTLFYLRQSDLYSFPDFLLLIVIRKTLVSIFFHSILRLHSTEDILKEKKQSIQNIPR